MEKHKITQIAKKLNVTHGAVSQWFNGLTLPKYKYMLLLNKTYNIPFEAWEDIKSYINENIANNEAINKIENENKTIEERIWVKEK